MRFNTVIRGGIFDELIQLIGHKLKMLLSLFFFSAVMN